MKVQRDSPVHSLKLLRQETDVITPYLPAAKHISKSFRFQSKPWLRSQGFLLIPFHANLVHQEVTL